MSISYHNCEVCGQSVELESGHQSEAANSIKVHQDTCLHIFLAAIPFSTEAKKEERPNENIMADALYELLEHAEMTYMFKHELTLNYYNWCLALFFNLLKNKPLLDSLYTIWKEKRKEERKEDEEKTTQIT